MVEWCVGFDGQSNKYMGRQFDYEPCCSLGKIVTHRPVIRSVSNSPTKPTSSFQPRLNRSLLSSNQLLNKSHPTSTSPSKSIAKASPPVQMKQKAKSSYYLSVSPSPSPHAKPNYSKPSDEHTRSSLNKPDYNPLQSTPNPSKHDANPKYSSKILIKLNSTLTSDSSTSKCLSLFNPLSLTALGVDELLDLDIRSLYREPEWEVEENEWNDGGEVEIFIVRVHTEGGRVVVTCVNDNPAIDDDSQAENFARDGEEIEDANDNKDVSLDEETDINDSRNDDQLKVAVDQRMQLGTKVVDSDGDRDVVVNKMARTLRILLVVNMGNGTSTWHIHYIEEFKEIIKALRNVMLTSSTCAIHYYKNFVSLYLAMEKIREKDPAAHHRLRDKKLQLWARFKFDTSLKCDDNTNNFVESFNHAIVKFRNLPILAMLEKIGKLIGSRFVMRFEKSQKWNGKLVPCILGMKQQLEDYVEGYFTLEKYRNLYSHIVHPIAASQMWEKRNLPDLDPLMLKRKQGRPRKQKSSTLTPATSTITTTPSTVAGPSTHAVKLEQLKQPDLEAFQAAKAITNLVLVKLYFVVKYY
ncbi:hypothetical protein Cgig2_030727 [Carnegiea gigantea]|uniref:Transposase n=1 Tax=Carnegiea gigantea TaxID=171969 RepID=A0A9Q1KQC2_9CARY|nr:hypothetical protein Cgig2_030727 [Carnegiea gigantea]